MHGGAGIEVKPSGNPISFMLFSFATIFIPFGIDYLCAGDFKGFVGKFALTFVGIGLIIGILNIIELISNPAGVLCSGTKRPLMPVLGDYFPNAYFVKENNEGCDALSSGNWLSGIFDNLIKEVPILRDIYATTEIALKTAAAAAKTATGIVAIASTAASAGSAASKGGGIPTRQIQEGGKAKDDFSATILSFTLALLFIGAAFLKGKDFVIAAANKTTERPGPLGNYLWRKKNVDDLPPAAPEPGIL
jgi:hypothetical protein